MRDRLRAGVDRARINRALYRVLLRTDRQSTDAECFSAARSSMVLIQRFAGDGKSRAEVSRNLGLSTGRVAQIEARALRILRRPSRQDDLKRICDEMLHRLWDWTFLASFRGGVKSV